MTKYMYYFTRTNCFVKPSCVEIGKVGKLMLIFLGRDSTHMRALILVELNVPQLI